MRHKLPKVIFLPDSFFTPSGNIELALNVSPAGLWVWRKNENFPPFHKSGRSTFYVTSQIKEWLTDRGVTVRMAEA